MCETTTETLSPDTPPEVTVASTHATLEMGGTVCPRCGGTVVIARATHLVEDSHYQEMYCCACGQEWTQVWELARVLVYGQGEDPDIFTMTSNPPVHPKPLKIRTDPERWDLHPDGTWHKTYDPRTLGQVWEDIVNALPAMNVDLDAFDYAGPTSFQARDESFPQDYRWLTSFAVRGDSEGHYCHTAVIYFRHGEQVLETLFLAKTFAGMEVANGLVAGLNLLLDN